MFSLHDLVQVSTFTFEEIEGMKWLPVSTEQLLAEPGVEEHLCSSQQGRLLIWTSEGISSTGPELKPQRQMLFTRQHLILEEVNNLVY